MAIINLINRIFAGRFQVPVNNRSLTLYTVCVEKIGNRKNGEFSELAERHSLMFYPPITAFYNQLQLAICLAHSSILPSNLFRLAHFPIVYSTNSQLAMVVRNFSSDRNFVLEFLPINVNVKMLYTLEYLYPALLDNNLGQKFLWQDKNFQKIFVLGQNFSEKYCPRVGLLF